MTYPFDTINSAITQLLNRADAYHDDYSVKLCYMLRDIFTSMHMQSHMLKNDQEYFSNSLPQVRELYNFMNDSDTLHRKVKEGE